MDVYPVRSGKKAVTRFRSRSGMDPRSGLMACSLAAHFPQKFMPSGFSYSHFAHFMAYPAGLWRGATANDCGSPTVQRVGMSSNRECPCYAAAYSNCRRGRCQSVPLPVIRDLVWA